MSDLLRKVKELCKQIVIGKVKTIFGEYVRTNFYAEIGSTFHPLTYLNYVHLS